MAYKFQLGAAVLSGSLTQEGQVLAKDSALSGSSLSLAGTAVSSTAAELNLVDGSSAGTIVNSKAVVYGSSGEVNATTLQIGGSSITATADEINLLDGITRGSILVGGSGGSAELDAKTSGRILVGDGTDIASVAVSGDATLAANGALTIAAGAIEHGMLAEDIISGQANLGGTGVDDADEFMLSDAGTIKAITGANLYGWVFSKVSGDATVASGGALTIANDAVEQAMIADDAVGADQLASNAVVDASVASNAAILASKIQFNTDLGGNVTFGNQSDDTVTFSGGVTIAGNLTVQGASVEVQQGFVVTSSVQFEGSTPDGNEISLTSADPSADRTITLPDLSGHVPLLAGAVGNANVTAAEFLLLDGGSTVGTTALADADGFMHNDNGTMKQTQVVKIAELAFGKVSGDATIASGGALTIANDAVESTMLNDNCISGFDDIGADIVSTDELLISDAGTLKRTDMSRLKTFIGSGTAAVNAIGDANAALAVGINAPSAAASAQRTWTLPASAGLTAGESIVIKAYGNASTYPLIIAVNSGQEIDGVEANLLLESDNAAITLYYMASDTFIIV